MAFGVEYHRDRIAAAFPDHDNNLALAILVPCQATVTAIFFLVGRLNATAEVPAIHFRLFAFPAEDATAHFPCPVAAEADRAVRTAGLASVCAMMPYR